MKLHTALIMATWLALSSPLLNSSRLALADERKKDAADYQKELDRQPWQWDDSREGLFYSMTQSAFEYRIEMIRLPRADDRLTIRFLKGTKLVCSWDGHFKSVFVQQARTLVYAQFDPARQGCALVAVNLDTGGELWRTNLQGWQIMPPIPSIATASSSMAPTVQLWSSEKKAAETTQRS